MTIWQGPPPSWYEPTSRPYICRECLRELGYDVKDDLCSECQRKLEDEQDEREDN